MNINDTGKRDFDKEAPTWEDNPERLRMASAIASGILEQTSPDQTMDVLDYGCGTGLITMALQPYVRSITAADSSIGMLEVLAAKAGEAGITNVTTRQLDLETDDPLSACFHMIVCSMTLHHIEDIAGLIHKFTAMLHPGGYLCIADLDEEDGSFHADPTGVKHFGFNREYLAGFLESGGFQDIKFNTAYVVTKPVQGGRMGEFSVFLVTGKRARY